MATLYSDRDAAGLQPDPPVAPSGRPVYGRRIDCADSLRVGEPPASPQERATPASDHDSRTRTDRADAH